LRSICKDGLEQQAKFIFDTLEQNLIGPNLASPELGQKLKAEFLAHFKAHARVFLDAFEKQHKDGGPWKLARKKELDDSVTRLTSEYNARLIFYTGDL